MVKTCCVLGCASRSDGKEKGLSFHRLPTDEERLKVWLARLRKSPGKVNANTRVCGKHFEGGRRSSASDIPSIFPWTQSATPRNSRDRDEGQTLPCSGEKPRAGSTRPPSVQVVDRQDGADGAARDAGPVETVTDQVETDPAVDSTEIDPAVKSTEIDPAVDRTEIDPAVECTEIDPAVDRTEIDPAVESSEIDPAVKSTEIDPAVDRTEIDPAVKSTEVDPAVDRTEIDPAVKSTEIDPAVDSTEIDPAVECTEVAPAVDRTEIDPAVDSRSTEFHPAAESDKAGTSSGIALTELTKSLLEQVQCLQDENALLKYQLGMVKSGRSTEELRFSFSKISRDDALVRFYTGLPDKEHFLKLSEYLSDCSSCMPLWRGTGRNSDGGSTYLRKSNRTLPTNDELLLTLMKLRLDTPMLDLSMRFFTSTSKVSIFSRFSQSFFVLSHQ